MKLSSVDNFFWAVGYAGHLILILVLFRRRLVRGFPLFTSLIAFNLLRSTVLRIVRFTTQGSWYFDTYWLLYAVDIGLQFLVVYEIASSVFRPMGHWAPDIRKRSILWITGSVLIAGILTLIPKPAVDAWYQPILLKSSFMTSVLECELFLGIVMLSWQGGFAWNSHVARIALGFALFAFPDMIVEIGTTRFGLKDGDAVYQDLIHIRMSAYIISLLFWIVTLWMKVPPRREMTADISRQLDALNTSVDAGLHGIKAGECRHESI